MKLYSVARNIFSGSIIISMLNKFDNILKNKIYCSTILDFFGKKESSDSRYLEIINKLKFVRFNRMRKHIEASKIVSALKYICDNITNIPIRVYGALFLILGVFGYFNSVLFPTVKLSVYLSVILAAAGFVLIFIKKSLSDILADSRIFRWIFGYEIKNPKTILVARKHFFGVYILFAISSIAFGTLVNFLILFMVMGIALSERYSYLIIAASITILPFLPTMAMVAVSIFTIMILISKIFFGFCKGVTRNSIDFFVFIFAAVYILGFVASVDVRSSLKPVLVYECFILMYFAVTEFICDKQKLLLCFRCAGLFSIPVSLYGIYQKFTGFDKQNTWVDTDMFEDISGRIVSFFENPNVYGEYIILLIAICLICFLQSKRMFEKLVFSGAIILNLICLIFTYSRGCWIGTAALIMIFLLLYNRKMFLCFCLAGVASFPFWPQSIINRIASVGNVTDSSTSYRVFIWKGTLRMLKDYWITGVGVGHTAFNKVYPGYSYSTIIAPHAHNLYLVILSELGILGLFVFLFLMLMLLKKLYVAYRNSDDNFIRISSIGMLAGTVGFLIQGMFDNVWYNYRLFMLFWAFAALSSCVYNVYLKGTNND